MEIVEMLLEIVMIKFFAVQEVKRLCLIQYHMLNSVGASGFRILKPPILVNQSSQLIQISIEFTLDHDGLHVIHKHCKTSSLG
jgi:hypothetical protein